MVNVRGDVLRPPHGSTPAAVKANKKIMGSFKSNENILKTHAHTHTHTCCCKTSSSCPAVQATNNYLYEISVIFIIRNHKYTATCTFSEMLNPVSVILK